MVALLHAFFAAAPLAAIALALALGYLLGKLRIGTFVLGPVAATLLVAIAFGGGQRAAHLGRSGDRADRVGGAS